MALVDIQGCRQRWNVVVRAVILEILRPGDPEPGARWPRLLPRRLIRGPLA